MKMIDKANMAMVILVLGIMNHSCRKLVTAEFPIDKSTDQQVYSQSSTAIAAMTGLYDMMSNDSESGFMVDRNGIALNTSLYTDEIQVTDPNNFQFSAVYTNSTDVGFMNNVWTNGYLKYIYRINSIIAGVTASDGIPAKQKTVLIGEAKFLRAFAYFHLVNLYGGVPLVLSKDFAANGNIPRTPEKSIYEQIVHDLLDARDNLTDYYLGSDLLSSTTDRIRPNKFAATALLARVYLYMKDWRNAESLATEVISSAGNYKLVDLDKVFLKNSEEAIWQIQPNPQHEGGNQQNTADARVFISYQNSGIYDIPEFRISDFLLAAFEDDDERRKIWIKNIPTSTNGVFYPIPFKYKVGNNTGNTAMQQEYTMILRLSEQYLIRAEARAHNGDIQGARSDLNVIRYRAKLPPNLQDGQSQILKSISNERYVELFAEMGHRFFDLKRLDLIGDRMRDVSPNKGGSWLDYKAYLPIPLNEIRLNSALVSHQNSGYPEK